MGTSVKWRCTECAFDESSDSVMCTFCGEGTREASYSALAEMSVVGTWEVFDSGGPTSCALKVHDACGDEARGCCRLSVRVLSSDGYDANSVASLIADGTWTRDCSALTLTFAVAEESGDESAREVLPFRADSLAIPVVFQLIAHDTMNTQLGGSFFTFNLNCTRDSSVSGDDHCDGLALMPLSESEYVSFFRLFLNRTDDYAKLLPILVRQVDQIGGTHSGASLLRILSVGAGDGAFDAALYKALAKAPSSVVALEPNRTHLAALTRNMLAYRSSKVSIVAKTFDDFCETVDCDAVDGTGFDAVLFTHSVYYMEDKPAAIRKALALLKPGGQVMLSVAVSRQIMPFIVKHTGKSQFSADELGELLAARSGPGQSPDPSMLARVVTEAETTGILWLDKNDFSVNCLMSTEAGGSKFITESGPPLAATDAIRPGAECGGLSVAAQLVSFFLEGHIGSLPDERQSEIMEDFKGCFTACDGVLIDGASESESESRPAAAWHCDFDSLRAIPRSVYGSTGLVLCNSTRLYCIAPPVDSE